MPSARAKKKATILIVKGDPQDRRAARRALDRAGHLVKEASSEAQALRLAGSSDLVVSYDAAFCRRLKLHPAAGAIPVLLLAQARDAPADAGADACLSEPADAAALVAVAGVLVRLHRAELRERQASRICEAALESGSRGACLTDASGSVRYASRTLCELVGKPREELIGRPFRDLPPGAAEPREGWPFERARRSLHHESASIEAGGRRFRVSAEPLLDNSGTFLGALCTVVELTGGKAAGRKQDRLTRQLDRERARLETVLDQMPSGVIMAEAPSGTLVLTNKRVELIFRGAFRIGGGPKDYLQYPAFRPGGRAYRPEEHPLWRSLTAGEVIADEEMEFVRADRTRASLLVSSAPIRDRDGGIVAAVVVLHDVTERSQLEQQLRHAQKMEATGRLAGGVAHDFNNLLTVIGGYGQMVRDSLDARDSRRGDLDAVLEAASRATDLTRQLLTFSRRQMVEPRVLDLNRQVARVGRMLRRVIGEDVALATSLKADPAWVTGDPTQIQQILLNVAVNARDAMPRGGALSIETQIVDVGPEAAPSSQLKPGRYVVLVMKDTGVGMDAETQSHLFEPFFTTKAKGKGTGLGLSTVYGIVKQNGGEILIESRLGRGTTVRIYFPLAGERVRTSGAVARRAAARTGTETVLLAEDDAEVRRLASEMLTRQGYEVLEAASGREALRLWRRHRETIGLLLTDVIMPLMSGPELAAKLRADRPDLKVLYTSGYAEEVLRSYGVTESDVAFIRKPFTPTLLAGAVRSLLDEKGGA
jgi:two-component system cell cycle sensor histidine kinase/response regulator CckA